MKYSGRSNKKAYITDIRKCKRNGQETYEVKFADGNVYKNIEANEENLQKVIDKLNQQAKDNIENLSKIYTKKITWLTGAGFSLAAGAVMLGTPMISDLNSLSGAVVVSAISLAGTFLSCYKAKKYSDAQKESEKIDYRNENRGRLENFKDYPNSLVGLSKKKRQYFKTEEKPFCITKIDEFTKKDLETINDNIKRESELGFTYVKKRNQKNTK